MSLLTQRLNLGKYYCHAIAILINTIGLIQAIFLGSLLLLKNPEKSVASRLAGVLLLVFSVFILNSLRILIPGPLAYSWVEIISNFSLLLVGPLLYFYTRLECSSFTFHKKHLYHFLPFVAWFACYAGFRLFIPVDHALVIGIETAAGVFLVLSLSGYLIISVRKAMRSHQTLRPSFRYALIGFSLVWFINFALQLVGYLSEDNSDKWRISATLLLSVLVVILCYQNWTELIKALNPVKSTLVLSEEDTQAYRAQIETEMQMNKPYLNPDYSLAELSTSLQIPSSYLSKVINAEMEMSFRKYLAFLRIKEFVRLAESNTHAHLSIMGLAKEVGFKSSSTFNQAFKTQMKMLPSAFMRSLPST